ncbi:MAG: DUF4239 domain-containing protein [Acidobacteria bacterium]|nr:DUF4239 domain-containing protein [Acidobacteriota bacterium]
MPIWLYEMSPLRVAITMVVFIEFISLSGLFLARRFVLPRLHYGSEGNEPISGTVQAIGVFYGITVGLIAVGVWNTNDGASDLVSKEATAIASLYRDVSGYPAPVRDELRAKLREYTVFIIEEAWPAQHQGRGQVLDGGRRIMDDFQSRLYTFEPATPGQAALHSEALRAYNNLLEYRRLRIVAVESGLSTVMWMVIWVGAAISIGVAYFYRLEDPKLHFILVALMGGFLAMVLFMIVINDRPFYGHSGISSDPYKLVLERLIDLSH